MNPVPNRVHASMLPYVNGLNFIKSVDRVDEKG